LMPIKTLVVMHRRDIGFLRDKRHAAEDSSPKQEFCQTRSMFFVPQPHSMTIIDCHNF